MQTLVICIDRDNDLGEKAGVSSPIIGRAANLDAAVKLASSDPEDSDINTIFGGINVYDKLTAEKNDAEIVSIAGDKKVGIIADKKISGQLDRILAQLKPEKAILVSDGAEDESVLPIIQSRIKVDAVHRIIVKQHENLESTYYIIKKAFNDPKISHTFFMPIGLVFLIYAISLYFDRPGVAVTAITAAIGIYMLFRGTGLDDAVDGFKASLVSSLHGGKITFVMYLAAIILSLIGTVQGGIEAWNYYNREIMVGYLILLMGYVNASTWWYVLAGVLINAGKIIDLHLAKEKIGKQWSHPFFVIAGGILFWAGSTYILVISEALGKFPFGNGRQFLAGSVTGAVLIAILGAWISTKSTRARALKK
jgi:putative membrane protein